jgi:hypothetical protein
LIGIHVDAVAADREYEPLFSHYPMYATPMRAGSTAEQQLLESFRRAGRSGQRGVFLIYQDGSERNATTSSWMSGFFRKARLYRSPPDCALDPRTVAVRTEIRPLARRDGRLVLLPAETLTTHNCR